MLKIGVAQVSNHFEYEANFLSMERALRALKEKGAELAFFPECATTGYNSRMLNIDDSSLAEIIRRVRALARELSLAVALPTPWPDGAGGYFNSVLFLDEKGETIHRCDKSGLQKGEEKLFAAASPNPRAIEFKGFKLGVVMCVETTHGPWEFVKPEDKVDVILWPGFYAPKEERTSADEAVEMNQREWGVPLLLANCASSPEAEFWPGRKFGGSTVTAASGEKLFTAKLEAEDHYVVEVGKDRSARVWQ